MKAYRRLNARHAAGARAIKVWSCNGCELHHRQDRQPDRKKPAQCMKCGRMDFTEFPSVTEANHWATLRFLEKNNLITDLRRQVWFDLLAYGPNGEAVKVARYVADYVYVENGKTIISDAKPKAGVDDLADLKMKIMAANGRPVKVVTS